jgi:hypothetical protein
MGIGHGEKADFGLRNYKQGEVLYSADLGRGLFGTGIRFTFMAEKDRPLLQS